MKKKIIASTVLLGIAMAPFMNGEVVRERRMPIPHQQPEALKREALQLHYSLEQTAEMGKQQASREEQKRLEGERRQRLERQRKENLEARQKLHDKEGFYYSSKFVIGSCSIKEKRANGTIGSENSTIFGATGALGYRFFPALRLELEGGTYTTYRHNIDGSHTTCMGQVYVDIFPFESVWKPYVYTGIGVRKINDRDKPEECYNVGFGVAYAMTSSSILDISFRWRGGTPERYDNNTVYVTNSREFTMGFQFMF